MQLIAPKAHAFKGPPNSSEPTEVPPPPHPNRWALQPPEAVIFWKIEKRYSLPVMILEGSISCLMDQTIGWISLRLSPPVGGTEESKIPH